MRLVTKYSVRLAAIALFMAAAAIAGLAQDARLNFDRLNRLEERASDVVEVNLDGKMLDLARRVAFKVDDADARRVAQAINGLKGIYVRVYNFDKESDLNVEDVDEIRAQLNTPGWERIANVRSKRNNQKVDVFSMFSGELMSGIAVVISESRSIVVVNVVGPIDLEMLVEMSGRMNIPKLDLTGDLKSSRKKEDKE